jgi:hypothetical protein
VWQCRYSGIEVPDALWRHVEFGRGKPYSDNQAEHVAADAAVLDAFDTWRRQFVDHVARKGKVEPGRYRAFGYRTPSHRWADVRLKWRELRMKPHSRSGASALAARLNRERRVARRSEGQKLRRQRTAGTRLRSAEPAKLDPNRTENRRHWQERRRNAIRLSNCRPSCPVPLSHWIASLPPGYDLPPPSYPAIVATVAAAAPPSPEGDKGASNAEVLASVVTIQVQVVRHARGAPSEGSERRGTGVVVEPAGLILTSAFLVQEADSIVVTTFDSRTVAAVVAAQDATLGGAAPTALLVRPLPIGSRPRSRRRRQSRWRSSARGSRRRYGRRQGRFAMTGASSGTRYSPPRRPRMRGRGARRRHGEAGRSRRAPAQEHPAQRGSTRAGTG